MNNPFRRNVESEQRGAGTDDAVDSGAGATTTPEPGGLDLGSDLDGGADDPQRYRLPSWGDVVVSHRDPNLWPVRQAAWNCVNAMLGDRLQEAVIFRLQFLRFASQARSEGQDVGSLLEEAWGGYKGPVAWPN